MIADGTWHTFDVCNAVASKYDSPESYLSLFDEILKKKPDTHVLVLYYNRDVLFHVSGSLHVNEGYEEGAWRELKEEIGGIPLKRPIDNLSQVSQECRFIGFKKIVKRRVAYQIGIQNLVPSSIPHVKEDEKEDEKNDNGRSVTCCITGTRDEIIAYINNIPRVSHRDLPEKQTLTGLGFMRMDQVNSLFTRDPRRRPYSDETLASPLPEISRKRKYNQMSR